MRKKLIIGIIVGVLVFLFGATAAAALIWQYSWQGKILGGVSIEGIDVGGLTEGQAVEKLGRLSNEYLNAPVKLTLEQKEWQFSRAQLGISLDSRAVAHRAYLIGRHAPVWRQFKTWWYSSHQGIAFSLTPGSDVKKAEGIMTGLAKEYCRPPQDARLTIDDSDRITITPGVTGKVVDARQTLSQLLPIKKPFAGSFPLIVKEEQPKVTTKNVEEMKVTGMLSAYGTSFSTAGSAANRAYNIHVAADALDNYQIKPGEVLDFNKVVGPRSGEAGYKEAIVIEQNKFVPGLGGGVCQVSTTLYNTALLSGLDIVERYNHSLAVGYVPLGRDATVSYGGCNLRFRNNTSGYLVIKSKVVGGNITFKIFGNTAEKKEVTIESVVEQTIPAPVVNKSDPNLLLGKVVTEQAGSVGYRVRVYRTINGVRKQISYDYYTPQQQIIRVGKMQPPPTPPPATPPPPAPATP